MAGVGEAARVLTSRKDPQQYLRLKPRDALVFIKTCYYEIHPAYFDNKHLYKQIKCDSSLVNLGRTSYHHQTDFTSMSSKETLFRCIAGVVLVDGKSRRPKALSDDFRQTVGQKMKTIEIPRMEKLSVPQKCMKVELIANWRDCDEYKHVNQGSYLGFCQSAAEQLAWAGSLHGYESNAVKVIQALHLSESSAGDRMLVSVWKQDSKFCFDITNNTTQKPTYQAIFCPKPTIVNKL